MKTPNFNQYHTLQVRFTYSIQVEVYHGIHYSEAATQRCSYEKVFWKYAANLQENNHAKVRFQCNFIEIALRHGHFGTFSLEHLWVVASDYSIKAWQNIECQIQQNFRFQCYTCMNSYQYWCSKLNFENNKTYKWVSGNVRRVINELIDKACFLHRSSIQFAKLRVIPESTKAINIKR